MTRKTYVKFEQGNDIWSNPAVHVKTLRGDLLGSIVWYRPWKQYVFEPMDAVFSSDCMQDIAAKVEALTKERAKVSA